VAETRKILNLAVSEDDLKIEFEKLLAPILKTAGINCIVRYNRLGEKAKTVYSGRPDAVHGQVIIEYEAPLIAKFLGALAWFAAPSSHH